MSELGGRETSIAGVRVVVISVGRLRAPYVDDVEHYAKLLGRYTRLEQIELRDDRPREGAAGERLGARLPPRAFVSLLAADGESLDSLAFAAFIEARRASGRDLVFVIGGAHGLALPAADHRLSLGPMTLPHQLARVVLLEALFRAHRIIAGEPYHY
ncbi:MAG TPA: 23S rRNA (pseudouridine(1915)-N(3))-methyltransferase RlmH [Solirubrobacteraceae bacterium]|nr:23S rRNA (pseudouridine(1915)-N(3))-methyltransferase RlmH [Solirubrobacteraceae bacterium]